jgi:hypothetical protein
LLDHFLAVGAVVLGALIQRENTAPAILTRLLLKPPVVGVGSEAAITAYTFKCVGYIRRNVKKLLSHINLQTQKSPELLTQSPNNDERETELSLKAFSE